MSQTDKQFEFLQDVAKLIQFCVKNGYKITAGEMWRTQEQQAIYVETGRSLTMDSLHRKRQAIDLNFFSDGDYVGIWGKAIQKDFLQPVGDFWESLNENNRWGGNWKFFDPGHFERRE